MNESKKNKGANRPRKKIKYKSNPQHKLFSFISKHFGGNISKAARQFGLDSSWLAYIIREGVLDREIMAPIAIGAKKIDKRITLNSLFTKPRKVTVIVKDKRKPEPIITEVIRPSFGGFLSVGNSLLSRAIARLA